jgi:hypothetical protein
MTHRDLSLSLAEALIRTQIEAEQGASPGARQQGSTQPPFTITISREAGALGNSVATEVGRRLEWAVYDRNLLDKVAERLRRPPSHLEDVDERPGSWLGECFSGLFDKVPVGSDIYLKYLLTAVRGLGAAGQCIIVGRGANFILPAETTLRVRLVARREDRVGVIARRLSLPDRDAVAWVEKTERERCAFIKHNFKENPEDPHHYDLVLNLSRLSVAEAADIIIETLRQFLQRGSPVEQKQAEPASPVCV